MESKDDFREAYRKMPDYQVLQIASEGGLEPEADQALKEELTARGIAPSEINQHVDEVRQQILQQKAGHNPYSARRGIGIAFRGKRFASDEDERLGIQLRTRWFILFWIPVIPLGSYRLLYDDSSSKLWGRSKAFQVVSQEKLDWQQVMTIWSITASVILILLFVISRL